MKTNKKTFVIILLISSVLLLDFKSIAQNIGINETGASPDQSAILELQSADKGFLITRTDTADISSPAFGLMTLAPEDSCVYIYNGKDWTSIGGGGKKCDPKIPPTFPCNGFVIPVVDVTNPTTGDTWMDRNLGAS